MGQKVNPRGMRLKISDTWDGHWYADKNYGQYVIEDIKIRNFIRGKILKQKGYERVEISKIKIKRYPGAIEIYIYTSKPGLLIGKKGADIEKLKKGLFVFVPKKTNINVNISEIKKTDLDAFVVSQVIGKMIEQRVSYKKAMKQAITRSVKSGALGVKVMVAGRLGGLDMARRESFKEGSVPLHTFDAYVDYAKYDAQTTYGMVGVSVWIYKGKKEKNSDEVIDNIGSLVTKQ